MLATRRQIMDDVKMVLYNDDEKLCSFWFNTKFVDAENKLHFRVLLVQTRIRMHVADVALRGHREGPHFCVEADKLSFDRQRAPIT